MEHGINKILVLFCFIFNGRQIAFHGKSPLIFWGFLFSVLAILEAWGIS